LDGFLEIINAAQSMSIEMVMYDEVKRRKKEVVMTYLKTLLRYLPSGTEGNYEIS
jgi:hypothetical protein